MFISLADISNLDDKLKINVAQHLEKLKCEFKTYFSEISRDDLSLARNPFRHSSEKVKEKLQDQFIDMKNDSSCQDVFEAFPVTDFWLRTALSYPEISKAPLKKLLPFSSTWLCESTFSTLLNIKTKQWNRLEIEQDIRCSLSSREPRIKNLVANVHCAGTSFSLKSKWLSTILSIFVSQFHNKIFYFHTGCLFRAVYLSDSRNNDGSDEHRAPVLPHSLDPLLEIPRSTCVWLLCCTVEYSRNHQA